MARSMQLCEYVWVVRGDYHGKKHAAVRVCVGRIWPSCTSGVLQAYAYSYRQAVAALQNGSKVLKILVRLTHLGPPAGM